MKVTEEAGVLARSERFFATPGTVARGLFYYITRAGHYYYDENYDFRDNCEIAHLESHRNFYLLYVRAGTMYGPHRPRIFGRARTGCARGLPQTSPLFHAQ